jgi:type IV secretory pathway VirB4 component
MRTEPRFAPLLITTANLGAAYPFMAGRGLGTDGVWIGCDYHDRSAFCYSPWELYDRGVLMNYGMLIAGDSGAGKSALKKSYTLRSLALGGKVISIDPAGEDHKLCRALGVDPIRLERGGRIRLNPLDARIADPDAEALSQLDILHALIEAALRRRMTQEEAAAAKEALNAAKELARETATIDPTLPTVAEAMLRPTDRAAQALNYERPRDLVEATRSAALALRSLCEEQLEGMFDGPTSAEVDFDAPFVSFDLAAIRNEDSLGVMRVCVASWVQRSLRNEPGIRRTIVLDEAWEFMNSLAMMRWLQASYKSARKLRNQLVVIMQHLADLLSAGDSGSEQERLALGVLMDSQTVVLYQQPPGEHERLKGLLGLSESEAEQVSKEKMPTGVALWIVNRQKFLVEHRLSSQEWDIVRTDNRERAA